MSADELAAAVEREGALPMPVPVVPEPQALSEAAELAAFRELELGDLDGRVSASCGNPSHPTWLRAKIDPRGCPWCEIDQAHEDAVGANLARYEEEQENRRLFLAWGSARMRSRRKNEALKKLRARIAELEAERHVTNEALDDAVQALRAAPKTVFRASHDSIVMGLYDNRQAAMDHVHATLGNEEGGDVTARVIWRADDPDADEPTWECWLFDADMADDSPTGYVVEPLEVASAYDEEADE